MSNHVWPRVAKPDTIYIGLPDLKFIYGTRKTRNVYINKGSDIWIHSMDNYSPESLIQKLRAAHKSEKNVMDLFCDIPLYFLLIFPTLSVFAIAIQAGIYLIRVNIRNTRTMCEISRKDTGTTSSTILTSFWLSLLLTLKRLRILFWLHCWIWTSNCRLGFYIFLFCFLPIVPFDSCLVEG